jgi:dihydrofolate synthase/folylpolyglutamate synthase
VAAFCDAALRAAGNKVGRFTSPHIDGPLAGVQINGSIIDSDSIKKSIKEIEESQQNSSQLTLFEIVTAIAFLHFSREEVDFAVIEVGLGGRDDATNIIDPIISIITSIDMEHQAILGQTLEEIAAHKAGIIKNKTPLILAPQKEIARRIILNKAESEQAKVFELGKDYFANRKSFDRKGQLIEIELDKEVETFPISLLGRYQIENAALAYAALRKINYEEFNLGVSEIKKGFANTKWPGRFELIEQDRSFILDAAHTPEAGKSLALSLQDYLGEEKITAIIGLSNDKNANEILQPIKGALQTIVFTQSRHPRAKKSEVLANELAAKEYEQYITTTSREALKKAIEKSAEGSTILVFGSVFLVEEIRKILMSEIK